MRSAPLLVRVKAEPLPALGFASNRDTEVINVDEDWSARVPSDFSRSIQSVLNQVASPPHNVEPSMAVITDATNTVVQRTVSPTTSELPMSKLQSAWISCGRPPRNVTRKFVEADVFTDRVDMVIFKAVDQRGSTTQPDSEWCKGAFSRLLEVCKGFFRVPLAVRCDRLFFERSDDAVYIDQMARYLSNDSVTTPPVE